MVTTRATWLVKCASKARVLLRIAAVTLLVSCCAIAQSETQGTQNTKPSKKSLPGANSKRPVEIENLISKARTLPAEFAIDTLLRLSTSSLVNKSWKQEILEEAFPLTANVQNSMRQRAIAIPGSTVDTRAGYRSYAFDHKLDQLSLRSRIIDSMLTLNRNRAFKMLSEVSPKLAFKNLSCADPMVYDVSIFYATIENVARVGFDEKRIEQGERLQILLPYVENMSSPAQVAPVAKLIFSLNLTHGELQIMTQTFAASLKRLSGDDRSFSAALTHDRTVNAVLRLTQSYTKDDVHHSELLGAFRVYLAKHFNAVRCIDTFGATETELPRHVREVNYFFPSKPFTPDDVKPLRLEDGAKDSHYFVSKQASKLLMDFKSLRGYDDDESSIKELKSSAGWQERWFEYLRQPGDWDGSSENSQLDYFHQKCVLYLSLTENTPRGQARDQIILSFIKLLSEEPLMRESHVEWFLHAHRFLQTMNKEKGPDRLRNLEMILHSKNPVLQVYAELCRANLF